jgi:hypothetical protein
MKIQILQQRMWKPRLETSITTTTADATTASTASPDLARSPPLPANVDVIIRLSGLFLYYASTFNINIPGMKRKAYVERFTAYLIILLVPSKHLSLSPIDCPEALFSISISICISIQHQYQYQYQYQYQFQHQYQYQYQYQYQHQHHNNPESWSRRH